MKTRASKIVFALTFLPIAFCVVIGIISAVGGMRTGGWLSTTKIYGFKAFIETFVWEAIYLCYYPVIPACIVIQIACLLRLDEGMRAVKLKKYIPVTAAAVVVVCGSILLFEEGSPIMSALSDIKYNIKNRKEESAAVAMYANADEIIPYRSEKPEPIRDVDGRIVYDPSDREPFFDIEGCTASCILIDRDAWEVGFIYDSYRDKFWKQKLAQTAEDNPELQHIREDYFLQAIIPLSFGRLVTFSIDGYYTNKTIAMILETEDGIYFADEVREPDTGFPQYNQLDESDFTFGRDVKYSDITAITDQIVG